ncbi:hypothetical protein, partial [Paracoccus denitrificans]|uniref:hypothetical protein n=1 Tax=Paracoccus denitrificans TaxID=266 RepID=UPI001F1997A3
QKRSRVRAVLPADALRAMVKNSPDQPAPAQATPTTEPTTPMRRRRVRMEVQADQLLRTSDNAVEALRSAARKVNGIVPPPDDDAEPMAAIA